MTDVYTPSSGMFNRQNGPLWANSGIGVDGLATAAEAITAAGLDWHAEKVPVYTRRDNDVGGFSVPTYEQVLGKFAIERDDTRAALGVVGPQYQPIQNREAFDFLDGLVDSGEAKYETAGTLAGGKRIWLLAKLPGGVKVADEDIERYLLLSNTHDGSGSMRVMFTPLRVICSNTLNMALRGADATRAVSIRHTGSASTKLQEARRTLGIGFNYFAELTERGQAMAETRFTDADFERLLRHLVPDPEEGSNARAVSKRSAMVEVYRNSDNLNNVRGTVWGAYNAVAEYEDHYAIAVGKDAATRAERRFARAVIEPKLKVQAEEYLSELLPV